MISPPIVTAQQRVIAIVVAVALVASFAIVMVAGGHGAGPVGLLLVLGSFSAWGLHMTLGWVGVLLTLAALFCSRTRSHIELAWNGLVGLAAAWLLFLTASEDRGFTFLFSLPFLALSVVRGFQLRKLQKTSP